MNRTTALMIALSAALATGSAWAKLPPPSEEQKAKAEETKAKTALADAKDKEALAKAQDAVAGRYIQAMKAKGITVTPTPIAPPAAAPAAPPPPAPTKP